MGCVLVVEVAQERLPKLREKTSKIFLGDMRLLYTSEAKSVAACGGVLGA
jgi:hypothetical protein